MTVRWERFAGNTDSFAIRIAFMPDPDAGHAADPAESNSWGAFQLWVQGQNLCTHVDQGEILQSAHWYLISLLEWFADHWNPFLHEERLPIRNASDVAVSTLDAVRYPPPLAAEADALAWDQERYEWQSRHALRSARSGGLFPNVVLRRLRDSVEISWDDEPLAGTPTGFRYSATSGSALLPPEQVAQPLYEVLTAAADYLCETQPDRRRTALLRRRLDRLREPGQTGTRMEWLAGLREATPLAGGQVASPSNGMHERWSQIEDALRRGGELDAATAALAVDETPLVVTGSCHAALMFSSLSPTVSENDVRTLASVMVMQYSDGHDTGALLDIAQPAALEAGVRPWEQGYDLAETVHARLDLDLSSGWVDIEAILQDLGVPVLTKDLDDTGIRACCILGTNHIPTIVRNQMSPFFAFPNAQRFSLAHELCHLLFDQSRGRRLAIASGPWAPRRLEQRANAFAAMFLMPTSLVERAIADIPDPVHDVASVSTVAKKLRMSTRATTEHLYNLTLMSESDRDELLRLLKD